MQAPDPPTVALAADYIESHGADTDCVERELWRAVLAQAVDDLRDPNERIRRDAMCFFEGPDLLRVLDLAGIDRDVAPTLRKQAMVLGQQPRRLRRRPGLTYQGETRSCREWAKATGLTVDTIAGRLRIGWPVERALTVPIQNASGHSRKQKLRPVHPAESMHS